MMPIGKYNIPQNRLRVKISSQIRTASVRDFVIIVEHGTLYYFAQYFKRVLPKGTVWYYIIEYHPNQSVRAFLSTLLVSPEWVNAHLNQPDFVVVDVRWYYGEPYTGRDVFVKNHIPTAVFLDLDDDLADRSEPTRGRHPLPAPRHFAETLARAGIGKKTSVIAYDDTSGSTAVRLWWMLRWLSHENTSILDGGITRWESEGYSLESGTGKIPARASELLAPIPRQEMVADRFMLEDLEKHNIILLDARAPERFRGEEEPIDFRAGHIPGAMNAPFANNLTDEAPQVFRSATELRNIYERLGVTPERQVVCYCGSGATACHNILALEIAGFTNVFLYPGSWSEWIHHH